MPKRNYPQQIDVFRKSFQGNESQKSEQNLIKNVYY